MSVYSFIADYRDNMQHFNRNEYVECFTAYKEALQEGLETLGDIRSEAEDALDKLEADWASEKKRRLSVRKREDDKMFICCFLNPALGSIGTEESTELENTLKECWDARFPKDPYELGSFESIANGFAMRIFGLKISKD